MSTVKRWGFGVACCAVSLVAGWTLRPAEGKRPANHVPDVLLGQPTADRPPASQDHAVAAALVNLSERLSRLESSVNRPGKSDPERQEKVATPGNTAEDTSGRAGFARCETALQRETLDARWSAEMQRRVDTALANPEAAGYALEELDCRTSLCRATVRLPESKDPDRLLRVLSEAGTHGGIVYSMEEGVAKPGTAVFFVARDNSLLPAFQSPATQQAAQASIR